MLKKGQKGKKDKNLCLRNKSIYIGVSRPGQNLRKLENMNLNQNEDR